MILGDQRAPARAPPCHAGAMLPTSPLGASQPPAPLSHAGQRSERSSARRGSSSRRRGDHVFPPQPASPVGFRSSGALPTPETSGAASSHHRRAPRDGADPHPAPRKRGLANGTAHAEPKKSVKPKNPGAPLKERFEASARYFSRQAGVEQIQGCRISA